MSVYDGSDGGDKEGDAVTWRNTEGDKGNTGREEEVGELGIIGEEKAERGIETRKPEIEDGARTDLDGGLVSAPVGSNRSGNEWGQESRQK